MTMNEAIRINALSQAVIDAQEWRRTFEEVDGDQHAVVEFGDIGTGASVDEGANNGWEGSLRMPRDIAHEMMGWLEERAARELMAAAPQ